MPHRANPPKRVSKSVWSKMSPAHQKILAKRLAGSGKKPYKKAYSKTGGKKYKSYSGASSSASCKKEIKKELSHTAMGPSIDSKAAICTDAFRIGEYTDGEGGMIQITDPTTGYNQIIELVLVNPGKLISLARSNMLSRGEEPITYKLEGYTPNYYRYSFNSLEIEITNTVPQQCSGDIMAFFIPDVDATVSPHNVLDIFESIRGVNGKDSHNAIIVPPGKTKSLHLGKTALLFTQFNPEIEGQDARLSCASILCIAAMSQFLSPASITAAGTPNSAETRRWNAEVAIVKLKTSCHFFEKQYVPNTIVPGTRLTSSTRAYQVDQNALAIVALQAQVAVFTTPQGVAHVAQAGTGTISATTPQPSGIPDVASPGVKDFRQVVLQSAILQAQLGETVAVIDCLGRKIRRSRQNKAVWSINNNALFASNSFFEWSWSGAFDFVTTYVGGFIKTQLTNVFGAAAAEGIYDIGKEVMYYCLDAIGYPNPAPGTVKNGPSGSNYTWSAQGIPLIGNALCAGILEPYSAYWFSARDFFKVNNPTLYSAMMELEDAGQNLELFCYPPAALHNGPVSIPQALNGPLDKADGEIEVYYTDTGGVLELEEGFGKPLEVADPGHVTQLAMAPAATRGIDPEWMRALPLNQYKQVLTRSPTPVSFCFYHTTATTIALGPTLVFVAAPVYVGSFTWDMNQMTIAQLDAMLKASNTNGSSKYTAVSNVSKKYNLVGHLGQLDVNLSGAAIPSLTATTLYNAVYTINTCGLAAELDIYPIDHWPVSLELNLNVPASDTSVDALLQIIKPNNVYYDTGSGDVQGVELNISSLFNTPDAWYFFQGYVA